MSSPDRKRPRAEYDLDATDAANGPQTDFENHSTLYFDDGNIIIKCKRTLFRVHRSLLSRNSTVFQELFAQCDARPQDVLRGCPVLSVDDDKDDMQDLLNCSYDALLAFSYFIRYPAYQRYSHIDFPTLTVENLPALSGLLRLTTKYRVERPRVAILNRLRQEWPSSLAKHDEKMAEIAVARRARANPNTPLADDLTIHPTSVISLLRQCNYTSPDLLAPLFYDLSTRVWQFGKPVTDHHLAPLSPSDIERFIFGLNALRSAHASFTTSPTILNLPDHAVCHRTMILDWVKRGQPMLFWQGNLMSNPFEDWGLVLKLYRVGPPQGMCLTCYKLFLDVLEDCRQKLWDGMAGFFTIQQQEVA